MVGGLGWLGEPSTPPAPPAVTFFMNMQKVPRLLYVGNFPTYSTPHGRILFPSHPRHPRIAYRTR